MDTCKLLSILAAAVLLLCSAPATALEIEGINFVGMPYTRLPMGDYRAKLALEQLATTGAKWISIPITVFQDLKNSTWSYLGTQPYLLETGVSESPSERDLASIIAEAKKLGLKVMLQFQSQINMPNWPDSKWIGDYWAPYNARLWFQRYTEHILHHLKALDGVEVDMISLGHNHYVLSLYEEHWKDLAATLRNVTKTPLTYSAAFGDEERNSGFWSSLDYVSVFPSLKSQTLGELEVEITEYVRALTYMSKVWKKPVLVTRVATCSKSGQAISQEQQIKSVYAAVKDLDFVHGIFVGDWAADVLYGVEAGDQSYNIQHKPAESVVRSLFGGQKREVERPEGKADYKLNCDCYRRDK